jgi:membrane associated rhomboid family serine protease
MGILYLLRNMPPAVKNLFFINVLFFIGSKVLSDILQVNLQYELGMKYMGSVYFKPFQIFTHMFMHASFSHILFNMFGLLMFGSMLERFIGTKKFLLLYITAGLGAAFLEQAYWAYRMHELVGELFPPDFMQFKALQLGQLPGLENTKEFIQRIITPMVGASGAIYGLLAAYALYFPNSELFFIFIPFPIKAKYLVPGLMFIDLFLGLSNFSWDSIAHFAHLGGALTGFVLIKIWNKSRSDFY